MSNEREQKFHSYEFRWTPDDCPHKAERNGIGHLHPRDCYEYRIGKLEYVLRCLQETAKAVLND